MDDEQLREIYEKDSLEQLIKDRRFIPTDWFQNTTNQPNRCSYCATKYTSNEKHCAGCGAPL